MVERLTREEASALTGPVDDVTLADIVKLGVTRAELLEAEAWIDNDEAMLNAGSGVRPEESPSCWRFIGSRTRS